MKGYNTIFILFLITHVQTDLESDVIQEEWSNFQLKYNKSYADTTGKYFRKQIYIENRMKIAKHNQLYEQGLVAYKLGVNRFADMLQQEFIDTFNGFKQFDEISLNYTTLAASHVSPANVKLAETVDWRQNGAVTRVKDQGSCGSCWAFSTTGSLEGQQFRKSRRLVTLSEQNLIDCSERYGNSGCEGGNIACAFLYIEENGGIDTEISYPYTGKDSQSCKYNQNYVGAKVKCFVRTQIGNERSLMEAVSTIGPVSVGIDAAQPSFRFYESGIYYEPLCNSVTLNHAVLVVGYGASADGRDYWLVKNSWGNNWGDTGYIKMARNRNNNCGIASYTIYPLV